MQSYIVMCNVAEDVECESYSNLSKNIIKIKRSSVLFCFCLEGSVDLTVGLIISLAIDGIVSIAEKVAVNLLG